MAALPKVNTPLSRSPCGERGLKCLRAVDDVATNGSLPVRGAWIEITIVSRPCIASPVAPRAGSVD